MSLVENLSLVAGGNITYAVHLLEQAEQSTDNEVGGRQWCRPIDCLFEAAAYVVVRILTPFDRRPVQTGVVYEAHL